MAMKRISVFAALAVTVLAGVASKVANASNIDFSCSLGPADLCTGTMQQFGSNFSSTGIDVFNDNGPYNVAAPFVLAFDTATKTISIDGEGQYSGQNLIGEITGFSWILGQTTSDLSFTAIWTTLPPAVQAQLGSPMGRDSGFVISLNNDSSAQSVDILITPDAVPEIPTAALVILGSGLLCIGGFRHVKSYAGS